MSRLGTRLKAVGRYIDLPANLPDFISPVNLFFPARKTMFGISLRRTTQNRLTGREVCSGHDQNHLKRQELLTHNSGIQV